MLKGAKIKRTLLMGFLGAIVLFIWSYISWMVFHWHQGEMNAYKTVSVVAGSSMWFPLISQFIVQYISACLVVLMLLTTKLDRYWCRVGFTILFGLAAGVFCYIPHWIWFGISAYYTFVNLLDSIIAWALVGLFIGSLNPLN